ncbi:MAG: hypothetical protein DRG31_01470 [Deltaproteobacteria bacterium]|nr:MAG: hypothetical protein DRG31_01470 [Deltaproteobacteria bacterium]
MIEVNLLPLKEVRRKEAKRFQVSVSILLVVLVLLLIFYLKWSAIQREKELDRRISEIKVEIARLDKIVKEIEEIKSKKELLRKRLDVAERLERGRLVSAMLMDDLSHRLPEKLWLEKLEKRGSTIRVSGIALDDETIADFMIALKGSPYVKKVELGAIKKREVGGVGLREFSLTYEFKVD